MQAGAQGEREAEMERGVQKRKERREAEVEAEVVFRFQIWTGLGQIPSERDLVWHPWAVSRS